MTFLSRMTLQIDGLHGDSLREQTVLTESWLEHLSFSLQLSVWHRLWTLLGTVRCNPLGHS